MADSVLRPATSAALAGLFAEGADGSPPPHTTALALPGGRTLYEAGSAADRIFFVRAGRLGVTRTGESGGPLFLGVVRPGEIVGEMAAIAGNPHSATVTALRDTELWAMPRDVFLETAQHDPRVMTELAQVILARARAKAASSGPRPSAAGEPRVLAFMAVSRGVDVRALAESVARMAGALRLRAVAVGSEAEHQSRAWFSALEAEHDVVLLAAEAEAGPWRDACARQADRVFLVADAEERPRADARAFGLEPLRRHRLVDLVLVRPSKQRQPYGGRVWREATGAAGLFHLRQNSRDDLRRLARVVSGRSVGLVLSGGSAPAYSHMGAIRALRERGVPIDFVGGTSMGAVIGAGLAAGWDEAEATARVRAAFVESNPLDDAAFPMLAMARGAKVEERLDTHFGDVEIDDLPLPYFCVSSDLTGGAVHVHESGRVREALRATVSLPGVLPPVIADGRVLVDGGVVRNFPADVMRERRPGAVVGVDVTRTQGLSPEAVKRPPFWPWVLSGAWRRGPPIISVLMRSATVMTEHEIESGRAACDLYVTPEVGGIEIRDWKAFEPAVAAGYAAMAAALEAAEGDLRTRLALAG